MRDDILSTLGDALGAFAFKIGRAVKIVFNDSDVTSAGVKFQPGLEQDAVDAGYGSPFRDRRALPYAQPGE
jgi:hypothetical protein